MNINKGVNTLTQKVKYNSPNQVGGNFENEDIKTGTSSGSFKSDTIKTPIINPPNLDNDEPVFNPDKPYAGLSKVPTLQQFKGSQYSGINKETKEISVPTSSKGFGSGTDINTVTTPTPTNDLGLLDGLFGFLKGLGTPTIISGGGTTGGGGTTVLNTSGTPATQAGFNLDSNIIIFAIIGVVLFMLLNKG